MADLPIKKVSELPDAGALDLANDYAVIEQSSTARKISIEDLRQDDASKLDTGTLPDGRFPATLPAASGVNLTALNASNVASGTLADARLSSNVPLLDTANTFTADQTIKQENAVNDLNMECSADFVGKNIIRMRNARGTDASKSHNNSGDYLLNLIGETYDGTSAFADCGSVRLIASQAHTASARGTSITLWNTEAGSTTPAVAVGVLDGGINANTTASAANVYVSAGNYLYLSTSSRRYKKDIEDIDLATARQVVDLVRPVWYRSLAEADNKDWSYWGIIAEELAEIDPRLVFWGYFEEDYEIKKKEKVLKKDSVLKPKGVQYDRITVLMLKVMQEDRKRLDDLEKRLAKLEELQK